MLIPNFLKVRDVIEVPIKEAIRAEYLNKNFPKSHYII